MKRFMKWVVLLLVTVAAVSASAWAQEPGYPITVVPPGKGPYQFPQGYQTPWDKIEMLVTEKLAPNLYSLHGSAGVDPTHPDAAGGRVAVLFGSDGPTTGEKDTRHNPDIHQRSH
jgi:hypothetical protein